jgi:hypothetical protein
MNRPFDYDTNQPNGLYVKCVCGSRWTEHDELNNCPKEKNTKYRPAIKWIKGQPLPK